MKGSREYRCAYCRKVFLGASKLRSHYRTCGMGKEPR